MSNFEQAIATVLEHEGGYVNDPNCGISLRYLNKAGELDGELFGDFAVALVGMLVWLGERILEFLHLGPH
jgi:hypothetical protein